MRRALTCITAVCLFASQVQAAILMQISSVDDFNLPTWSLGDPAVNATMDLCIYSALSIPGGYGVTVTSAGGYVLKNGGNSIPYSLSWDDGGVGNLGNSYTPLTNGVNLSGRARANIVSPVCLAGPNARLKLTISQSDMNAALAGTYTGTISITVSSI